MAARSALWTCGGMVALAAALAGCGKSPPKPSEQTPMTAAEPLAGSTGATADLSPSDPPGEWRRQARDYANTRFSPLGQINTSNIARLKIAWTFSDGIPYGHEA